MTIPTAIAHSVQQTQEWLKELCDYGDLAETHEALAILRAVLHQLRDRLTLEEAVDLAAQLPIVVRGIYYEGWKPHAVPVKFKTKKEFVDQVNTHPLPRSVQAEQAVRDVFAVLTHHCDPGEIADVIAQMPDDLKGLWPTRAQTFRARTR